MIRRDSHRIEGVRGTLACVAVFLLFSAPSAMGQQLTWTGSSTAAWNDTDLNWNPSGSCSRTGRPCSSPVGGNTTITIQPQGVATQTVTFTNNASTPYTFTGGAIGDYSQPTTVTLAGAGSVTFSNSNSYSGGTTVSAGTLVSVSANSLGTGPITLSGGVLVVQGHPSLPSLGGISPALWLDASDTASLTMSGGNVPAWANLGTAGGTATLSSGRTGATVTSSNAAFSNKQTLYFGGNST